MGLIMYNISKFNDDIFYFINNLSILLTFSLPTVFCEFMPTRNVESIFKDVLVCTFLLILFNY